MIPAIRLTGDPRERGRAYGIAAADRVRRSIDAYRAVFASVAGWEWGQVVAAARRYEPAIETFGAKYLEEMEGLAEGAGVAYEDVLAINTRTEVMFAGKARTATGATGSGDGAGVDGAVLGRGECSAMAVLPHRTAHGHLLVAQNWDWLVHSFETIVLLEVEQDDGPNFVTVVEAGLLAKTGLNDAGLAVATNALVTTDDRGEPGIPYHVMLRGLLDQTTMTGALARLHEGTRSSSANYLLGHRDGLAVDIEAAPGDFSRLYLIDPQDGVVLHTNHFVADRFDRTDVSVWAMPDSPLRLQRLRTLVSLHDGSIGTDDIRTWLADHANHPAGICCHPDEQLEEIEQDSTVVSIMMDATAGRMWVAGGRPCSSAFEETALDRVFQ
jgi:isopenicillin-N N-acyltransferase like protein